MPHDKATTGRFIDAEESRVTIIVQDIQPVGMIVTGDTAVAHYYHMTVAEFDGELETSSGRFTDILTRTGDGWRILSWVGNERSDEDDDTDS